MGMYALISNVKAVAHIVEMFDVRYPTPRSVPLIGIAGGPVQAAFLQLALASSVLRAERAEYM